MQTAVAGLRSPRRRGRPRAFDRASLRGYMHAGVVAEGPAAWADRHRQGYYGLATTYRLRSLPRPADPRAASRLPDGRGDAAAARQDAQAVRLRDERRRPGLGRVEDAGQSDPRISVARHPDRRPARHPAGVPRAGAVERTRRAARGRRVVHPPAARADGVRDRFRRDQFHHRRLCRTLFALRL